MSSNRSTTLDSLRESIIGISDLDEIEGERLLGVPEPDYAPSSWGRSQCMLDLLNFFVADVQSLGALAYIYCTSNSNEGGLAMSKSVAGGVMTAAGLLGVVAGPFFANGIDVTARKRFWVSIALAWTAATYVGLMLFSIKWVVGLILIIQGIVGSVYPPAVNSISIGIVGPYKMADRASRNEIAKHIGAILAACLPIIFVDKEHGYNTFFLIVAIMAVSAIMSVTLIRPQDINSTRARGGNIHAGEDDLGTMQVSVSNPGFDQTNIDAPTGSQPVRAARELAAANANNNNSGWTAVPIKEVLLRRDIALFLASVTCFHFANAALLPQVGSKIDHINESTGDESAMHLGSTTIELNGKNAVSIATIIAQVLMIPVAKACGWLAKQPWAGSKRTLFFAYLSLPIRSIAFAYSEDPWTLLSFQMLDGIGAGAFGVLAVLIMSDLSQGTGRFSFLQGALATGIGIGAAISNGLGGVLVDSVSFSFMFMFFGLASIASMLLLSMVRTKELAVMAHEGLVQKEKPLNNPYDIDM